MDLNRECEGGLEYPAGIEPARPQRPTSSALNVARTPVFDHRLTYRFERSGKPRPQASQHHFLPHHLALTWWMQVQQCPPKSRRTTKTSKKIKKMEKFLSTFG